MKRQLMVLAAAVVFALGGTYAVLTYVERAEVRALAGQEPVHVIVSKGDIARGTTIKTARDAGLLATDVLPRRSVPAAAVRELTPDMDHLVAASALVAGEVLLRGRFVEELPAPGSLTVPDGKLAVSVELSDPGRVGDFVRPGDDVAVFHYLEGKPNSTQALLPRVRVIGVGSRTEATPRTAEGAKTGKTDKQLSTAILTLALNQIQAQQLVHASYTGQLHLGLLARSTEVISGLGVDDKTFNG